MLLLLTFSALVANPEKLLYYTVDNPARGLLNRGKTKKKKSLAAPPPPPPPPPYPPPRCSFGEKTKINRATHPHDVCLGATQVGVTQVSKCVRPGEMQSVCVCVCVLFLPVHPGHQVRWTYQPGSHRRKVTQDFSSTFLLRCVPLFFSREGFIHSFPLLTVKSNFVLLLLLYISH